MTASGRTLAIGDIHGCDVALEKLLERLAPTADDTVVILGDVVDRGPGSREAIDQLIALRERCRLVFIQGNHEQMMLEALANGGKRSERWLVYGGTATLFSYGGVLERVPPAHVEFLKSSIDYWESGKDLFIHANLQPGVPLPEQDPEWLRWTHLTEKEQPYEDVRVICGHTPQKSGNPLVRPGWVGIDTFAWGSGWLTGLDVASGEMVQTTQSGQCRSGRLPGLASV